MLIQAYRDRILPFSTSEEILPITTCDYKDYTVSSQNTNPIISKYSIEDGVMYLDKDTQFLKITLPSDTQMVQLFVLNIKTITISGPWNIRPSCDVGMGVILYRQCLFSDQIEQIQFEYMRGQSASIKFNEVFPASTSVLLAVRTSSCCTSTYEVKLKLCSSQKSGVKSEAFGKPPSELFYVGDKLYKTNSTILSSTRDSHCARQDADIKTKVSFTMTTPPLTFIGDEKTCLLARAISHNRQVYFDSQERESSTTTVSDVPLETSAVQRQLTEREDNNKAVHNSGSVQSTPSSVQRVIDE